MSTTVNENGIVIEGENKEVISKILGPIMQEFSILLVKHLDKDGLKNDLRQFVTDIASEYDSDVTSEEIDEFVDKILYENLVPEAIREDYDKNEGLYDPLYLAATDVILDEYKKDSANEKE